MFTFDCSYFDHRSKDLMRSEIWQMYESWIATKTLLVAKRIGSNCDFIPRVPSYDRALCLHIGHETNMYLFLAGYSDYIIIDDRSVGSIHLSPMIDYRKTQLILKLWKLYLLCISNCLFFLSLWKKKPITIYIHKLLSLSGPKLLMTTDPWGS